MMTVGAFHAKTHLNALLKKASRGETIRITLRGIPIAKLVPDDDRDQVNLKEVVRDIRAARKASPSGRSPFEN